MSKVKIEIECSSCKGTGVYVGLAERDGAGVICHRCRGTGCAVISYTPFEARHRRRAVKRVYERNNGIVIGAGTTQDGEKLALEDFGGMPYKEWFDGKPFPAGSEDRKHICPMWWDQSEAADRGVKCPDNRWGCTFSTCPDFKVKAECWARWDGKEK